jgi:hypothetical protein
MIEAAIRGDFNSARDDMLAVSLKHTLGGAPGDVTQGAEVLIVDADGNMCLGIVEHVDGHLARVRLNWDSWKSEGIDRHSIAAG